MMMAERNKDERKPHKYVGTHGYGTTFTIHTLERGVELDSSIHMFLYRMCV